MKYLILVAILLYPQSAKAGIQENVAVQCIMGEARGESYRGKIAVAEALRNRGTIKGVYGCRAKFKEPDWVWKQAKKAWRASRKTNLVKGASNWESSDFKTPYWAKGAKITTKVGKHIFYRGVK